MQHNCQVMLFYKHIILMESNYYKKYCKYKIKYCKYKKNMIGGVDLSYLFNLGVIKDKDDYGMIKESATFVADNLETINKMRDTIIKVYKMYFILTKNDFIKKSNKDNIKDENKMDGIEFFTIVIDGFMKNFFFMWRKRTRTRTKMNYII